MCRSIDDGGRRCPCGRGARRRAYQRARYAIKKATAAQLLATPPEITDPEVLALLADNAGDPVGDAREALPSREEQRAAHRAEIGKRIDSARGEAVAALELFRTRHGQREAYTAAVTRYGSALREGALFDAAELWETEQVGDADVADLRHQTHDACQVYADSVDAWADAFQAYRKASFDLPGDRYDEVEDLPPEVAALYHAKEDAMARRAAADREYASRCDRLREMARRRNELFSQAVQARLSAERDMGGAAPKTYRTRLSAADREMLGDVLSMFPADMSARANATNTHVNISRASGKRAHFTSRTYLKTTKPRNVLVNPPEDAATGMAGIGWSASMTTRPMDEYLSDPSLRGPSLGGHRWEDTPDNRAALQALMDDGVLNTAMPSLLYTYAERRRREPKDLRTTASVVSTPYGLAIAVDAVDTKTSTDYDNPTAKVQFSDRRSMTHEFGHFMEFDNPEIGAACVEFRTRRAGGPDAKLVRHGGSKRNPELVVEGGFVTPYVGRVYEGNRGQHTEVFSVGVEKVLCPDRSGDLLGGEVNCAGALPYCTIAKGETRRSVAVGDPLPRDEEHFNLVLGLLATANRPVSDAGSSGSEDQG